MVAISEKKQKTGAAAKSPVLEQKFISPFLRAVKNVFATMVHVEVKAQSPRLLEAQATPGDIFALMLMRSEDFSGQLIISFTQTSLVAIASKMMMEEFTALEPLVTDTAGEIVNIVTGAAKLDLAKQGYNFDMAQPKVYQLSEMSKVTNIGSPRLLVPYESECGKFFVDLGFIRLNQ